MAPGLRNTSVLSFLPLLRLPNRFAARSISLNLYLSLSLPLPPSSFPHSSLFQLELAHVYPMYGVYRVSLEFFERKLIARAKETEREWGREKDYRLGGVSRWRIDIIEALEKEGRRTRPMNVVTRQRCIIDGLPSLRISRRVKSRWRRKINRPSDKLKTNVLRPCWIFMSHAPLLFSPSSSVFFSLFFFPCFGTRFSVTNLFPPLLRLSRGGNGRNKSIDPTS